ncbi:MAG: hypothetical protein FJ297_18070 [Planctomycetes bacterium]|nr:hypothetical protein [Planctomycetota bacterium]
MDAIERESEPNWRANVRIAWSAMVVGIATGMIMGLWSFAGPLPVPQRLGEYDDVARRLARLGHIACFGLSFVNLLLVRELERLDLSARAARAAALAMNFGNVALPVTLFLAAGWHPIKYVMPVPAACVLLAIAIVARGTWTAKRGCRCGNG